MVTIDNNLMDNTIQIRPSQNKFNSCNKNLFVVG